MKKNLPNIVFLLLVITCSAFLVFLFQSFGFGLFLKVFGGFMLLIGIFVFIFFLSIDPGYGWSKSVNFNANYIAISAAVIICIAGVILWFLGREVQVSSVQEASEMTRCRKLREGKVEDVVGSQWYHLSDFKEIGAITLYLFQKRGETDRYRIIGIDRGNDGSEKVNEISVLSDYLHESLVLSQKEGGCNGVFEAEFVTRAGTVLQEGAAMEFDVRVYYGVQGTVQGGRQEKVGLRSEYCLH